MVGLVTKRVLPRVMVSSSPLVAMLWAEVRLMPSISAVSARV